MKNFYKPIKDPINIPLIIIAIGIPVLLLFKWLQKPDPIKQGQIRVQKNQYWYGKEVQVDTFLILYTGDSTSIVLFKGKLSPVPVYTPTIRKKSKVIGDIKYSKINE